MGAKILFATLAKKLLLFDGVREITMAVNASDRLIQHDLFPFSCCMRSVIVSFNGRSWPPKLLQ